MPRRGKAKFKLMEKQCQKDLKYCGRGDTRYIEMTPRQKRRADAKLEKKQQKRKLMKKQK
jgi:hypothetical protein